MFPYRQTGFPPGPGPGTGFGPGPGPGFGPGPGPGFGPGPGGDMGPPGQPPSGPPPQTIPSAAGGPSLYAVDPGSLYGCLYRYTFMRLTNGDSFWFYPTFIGRRSVAGYRWFFFRWVYFGIDTNRIESFQCI
ncbi:hypothetical protein [Alteribacillus bidgolensis]|uniref:Transporter n=1 Tax=Alteribacillus bidgolensis TaxID=930129 RepID=A0A1G8MRM6_9BACI|nr:hypothetical protein [Alteribacillus bidgolensis]SDI70475.1 hypothetical protein SAMN05216352_110157 [Alteribacillus bidgolensis]